MDGIGIQAVHAAIAWGREEAVDRREELLWDVAEAAAELRAVVAEIAAVTPDWAMAYGFTSEMRTAQEWLPKLDAALKRLVRVEGGL